MKLGECDRVAKQRGVFLPQSGKRRQIGVFRRRTIPPLPDLSERMLGRGPPQDILAAIVIGDQRMLQADAVCNGANARSLKPARSEFGNGGVQDRGPRLDRSLLFGSLARAFSPDSFLRHLAFD